MQPATTTTTAPAAPAAVPLTPSQIAREAERMTRARTILLMDVPFFGTGALRLKMAADPTIKTAQTDGTNLLYNPAWTKGKTERELLFALAHETDHCLMRHMFRRGGRNPRKWNRAADFNTNLRLKDANIGDLPADALVDEQYRGLSTEQIYARLPDEPEDNDGRGDGDLAEPPEPGTDPGDQDGDGDGQGDGDGPMTEADWQLVAEQAAMVARKAGNMPGAADRDLQAQKQPQPDCWAILRQFIERAEPSHSSWLRPNRRYIHRGLYLPGTVRENVPRGRLVIDTSASITQDDLNLFGAHCGAILSDIQPAVLEVVYADAAVQGVETFTPEDYPLTLHPVGGGGTAFQPGLDYRGPEDEEPAFCVYLTDLYGGATQDPGYPVLWAVPERYARPGMEMPFGEVITVSEWV